MVENLGRVGGLVVGACPEGVKARSLTPKLFFFFWKECTCTLQNRVSHLSSLLKDPTKPCLIFQACVLVGIAMCIDCVRNKMLPILVEGAAAFGSKVVFIALSVKGLYDGLKAYRYAAKIGDEKGKSIALFNIALNGISLAGSLLLLVSEAHYFTSLSAQFLSVCATTVVSLFGIYYLMAITLECQKLYRTYQLKKQLTAKEDVDLAWNYLQHLYAPAANVGQDGELGLSTQSVVKSMQVAEQDLKRYMTQEGFEAICTAFNQHEENPSEKEKKALIEKTISELNKQQMCSAIHILGNLIAMSGTILGQVVSCGIASLSLLFVGGVVTFVASAFAEKGKQPEAKAADATRAQFGRELDSRALS